MAKLSVQECLYLLAQTADYDYASAFYANLQMLPLLIDGILQNGEISAR